MGEDSQEEEGIEIGDCGTSSCNGAPKERLRPVGRVVWLPQELPPSIDQQRIAVLGLQVSGILESRPGPLREGPADFERALELHAEARLLCHRRVKDPVHKDEKREEEDVGRCRELVDVRRVGGHIDDRVAVGERHAGEVPENDHESPLLVEHVPSLGNALFALGACINVEAGGEDHKGHVGRDISIDFVLLAGTTDADEEEEDPWDADLGPHL